jgi:hypothetical protein
MSSSIDLDYYLTRSSLELIKVRLILRQADDMEHKAETHCGCGALINALNGFRCLYCGLWLCVQCAETHFGLTRKEYDETPD